MADTEILRIKPRDVTNLFAEGRMKVITAPSPIERRGIDRMTERAKDILGQDFLGLEAVRNLEQKLKAVGQDVEFVIPDLPAIPYTEKDLELAKQNSEMLVLRVGSMRQGGSEQPLTLINFRELFKQDPLGQKPTVFYSFRPDANDWYKQQSFATRSGEIGLSWALVGKTVLPGSTGKKWPDQAPLLTARAEELKRNGASNTDFRRRTATEAVWDMLLYYTNTNGQLVPDKYDWTQTQTSSGSLVSVGWTPDGLFVGHWPPSNSYVNLGAVLSR